MGDGSGTAARVIGSCGFPPIGSIAGSTRDTVGTEEMLVHEMLLWWALDGQGVTKLWLEE